MFLCICVHRKSACSSSDSEKKDGGDIDDDNVAFTDDLQEVAALFYWSYCLKLFTAGLVLTFLLSLLYAKLSV